MKTGRHPIKIAPHFLRTSDGVRLRYFDSGPEGLPTPTSERRPEHPKPALIFGNGLGGPAVAFEPQFAELGSHYRVLTWDYRGLYASRLPPQGASLTVGRHARDVLSIADQAGLERFSFVGWSMGVQVGLEISKLAPERLSALVLMNGTFGRPLLTFPLPWAEPLLTPMASRFGAFHTIGEGILKAASRLHATPAALKRLRIIHERFDSGLFHRMLGEFKTLDLRLYLELLDELVVHDGIGHLPRISAPTLLVSGGRDRITPAHLSRTMAAQIHGAEHFHLPDATHYAAVEFPVEIARRIRLFLEQRLGKERAPLAPSPPLPA